MTKRISCGGVLLALLVAGMAGCSGGAALPGDSPPMVSEDSMHARQQAGSSVMYLTSAGTIFFAVILQAIAWGAAVKKLSVIREADLTAAQRLQHLDAIQVYFDLPLYFGLLGTVLAFILMTLLPQAGLMFAYISTALGILVTVSLRLFYVIPYRQWLIGYQRGSAESRPGRGDSAECAE